MNIEQIFEEIQTLPAHAQRALIERLVSELGGASGEPATRGHSPDDPFLGLLANEPELADEIHRLAKARSLTSRPR